MAEASALYEPYWDRRDDFGADVLALLDQGRLVPATDYVNAQRLRRSVLKDFHALFASIDCLFTPTTPITAPRIGQKQVELDGEMVDTVSPPRAWCAESTYSASLPSQCPAAHPPRACPSAYR